MTPISPSVDRTSSSETKIALFRSLFRGRDDVYEAIGYTIVLPASAIPGWPADVVLPSDPTWKRDYAGSVGRLVRDGVDMPFSALYPLRVTKGDDVFPTVAAQVGDALFREAGVIEPLVLPHG